MITSLEELQAHINQIPINEYLRLKLLEFGEGYSKLMMPYNPVFTNTWKTTHGGALMTLADIAFFVALATLYGLDVSGRISTVEEKTSFLSPSRESDLYATARVIKNGRKLIFGDVSITSDGGRIVSHSTVTYLRNW
ncbi:MAG: PaaI family thioesterase [Syntrophomonadaceae bacterium]|nr:PaaI family thioesterase [Syntrophomonadaceae bacterium]